MSKNKKVFKALTYHDSVIRFNAGNGLVSLTDMWKAEGSPSHKRPADWRELDATQELLKRFAEQSAVTALCSKKDLIIGVPGILESKRGGKAIGTYAIPLLAIDYAQILSVEFHQWALTALLERIEEENDPEQALSRGYERAVKSWKRQGYSDTDIDVLTQCVITRKDLTSTMKAHGIEDQRTWPKWVQNPQMAYGNSTNQIYKPLLGCTATEYREQHQLKPGSNVREHLARKGQMSKRAAIMLAETMARESMQDDNLYGFTSCKTACGLAGKRVARVFE